MPRRTVIENDDEGSREYVEDIIAKLLAISDKYDVELEDLNSLNEASELIREAYLPDVEDEDDEDLDLDLDDDDIEPDLNEEE